jgi:hypothetical protein
MEIKKGTYRLEKRGLNFSLDDDLDFKDRNNCFYFRGGNGFGKTSFLEKIIIPALKTDNVQYIYIGQDIRTQLYTLRALLAVQGIKVSDNNEVELLSLINIFLIMDLSLIGALRLSGLSLWLPILAMANRRLLPINIGPAT